ncbi:glycosyltransferase family 4 protein [Candidatus Nitrospira allomarina]|jgi:glycosyltransferase involved in cell wall biosynthesis|uniref:Glycosyltransferase family 4 protein n=1 Tax=Candidatus Nitrospira allomarina TaxID=3020900 RepID=A0AA96JSE3_9BACT|nr:glycosyltransferase family 4 protein [Candidatus Nitrospira allomarina]WNM57990.1 glycosyltransferase family 4 protein [Candidatus Nitrospira allomarina]
MKILLVGPLPPPLGGATVLFGQLVGELGKREDLVVEVINTTRIERTTMKNLIHALRNLSALLRRIRKIDVVGFHASILGAALFGPLLAVVCCLFRRPWIFRGFGGFYPDWYLQASAPARWIFRHTVLAADIVLFETHRSVKFFSAISSQPVYWYSNSRVLASALPPIKEMNERGARHFVYLGHVSEIKGVDNLIQASKAVKNVTVDVYGPLTGNVGEADFAESGAKYCGVVLPEEVPTVLGGYDVLVLPSRIPTEGYPGVILEAFTVGMPVIASRIGAIAEIVDERNGILIEPGQISQLVVAMEMLRDNPKQLTSLRRGAREAAKAFSSGKWTEEFVHHCHKLYSGG